ncbi:MAG TPA: multicopper oxidase domain-containing protein, partial [Gemmatimonadaceae bacterium]|nr:multicopper oxidase domain-containing protein [Gemmatimonadaceae bacterium]
MFGTSTRSIGVMLLVASAAVMAGCADHSVTGTTEDPLANAAVPLQSRIYYIAADLVQWDYAPSGRNLITGAPFGEEEEIFTEPDEGRIGRVYTKALYREYTDASFATLKPIPPAWSHLGMLGPLIRAQVGDTIKVVFKNNADRPYTMHPHGVFYKKDSEGAPY